MGGRVGDCRVTRHGFHLAHGRGMRPAGQGFLNTAMLIAQGDLQMEHFLARTLEPEVPRLDDAGMDRADRDFVYLTTVHAEKLIVGRGIDR